MPQYKCLIIRLEDNAHSCQMAKDCQEQAALNGITAEFFPAINGNDADFHYAELGIRKAGKFKKNRAGVMGSFLSHYYIWNQCVTEDIPFIVLEHDGYFIKSLPNNIFEEFDEVLKLDNLDPYRSNYNSQIAEKTDSPMEIKPYIHPTPRVKTRIGFNTNYLKGAYSYIIKPVAAKKLIDFINVNGHVPADQQLNSTIVDLKVITPTVVRLHPFYSIDDNIKTASLTQNL